MRRTGFLAALFSAACLAAGCGAEAPPDPQAVLAEADRRFAEGEARTYEMRSGATFDADADAQARAARAWHDAGARYRDAFRLLDPVPAERERRALVAFRAARSFAKAAAAGVDARTREWRAETALLWLAQAERLAPSMRQVHYERGALRDGDVEAVRDPLRARAAYQRYLEMAEAADDLPASEEARVAHAKARVAALAPAAPQDR